MKKRILVVDDNREVLLMLSMTLESFGMEAYPASSVGEAVQIVQFKPVDIILADYNIGDYSGAKFVSMLKSDPKTRNIPVLVLSGTTTPSQETEVLQSGAAGFLRKPFPNAALKDKILELTSPPPRPQ